LFGDFIDPPLIRGEVRQKQREIVWINCRDFKDVVVKNLRGLLFLIGFCRREGEIGFCFLKLDNLMLSLIS
jgi:hypothetical protein